MVQQLHKMLEIINHKYHEQCKMQSRPYFAILLKVAIKLQMVSLSIAPKGSKSWSKYQLDVANGTDFYTQYNCSPIFKKELKPLFIGLSGDELLKKCLRRVTQNQKKALNSILWKKCPKSVFLQKRKTTGAAQSVIQWNQNSAGSATVPHACGVSKYGINTLHSICREKIAQIV